jgi:hypothetical protein
MLTRNRILIGAAMISLVSLACGETPTETIAGLPEAQFGKGGKPKPPPESAVTVIYPAGAIGSGYRIYGDGSDGSATYVPGDCGIMKGKHGDCLPDDPDWGTRHIVVDYSACVFPADCGDPFGVQAGEWAMIVKEVHFIDQLNTPVMVRAQFNTAQCAIGFRFNSAYSTPDVEVSDLEVTLIETSPRRWLVKSVAPHVAVCVPDEHGQQPWEPWRYFYLPFELELVEVTG